MNRSSTIDHFLATFKNINVAELNLQKYPQAYCHHLMAHLDYYATIYHQVIELAVKSAQKPASSLTVLDFGAGNGFLGMYAKLYGFKSVWMCDVAQDFLQAAETTALKANIAIDGFITGDITAAQHYFQAKGFRPDILLATDVIEHVYDLEHLFRSLQQLNPKLISVFTTASNPYNFRKVKQLHKLQFQDEWIGYSNVPKADLEEKGLAELSFLEQRKKIIIDAFSGLQENVVSELAHCTRGKAFDDIVACVNHYLNTGIMPTPPTDNYWVCDPYTGSWTERILPLKTYRELAVQSGFSLHWVNGFYNPGKKSFVSATLVSVINKFIGFQKYFGRYIAPYIVLIYSPFKSNTSKIPSKF